MPAKPPHRRASLTIAIALMATFVLAMPALPAAASKKPLDVWQLAKSCAWIQQNSGARNAEIAARHIAILKAEGVPWRRCINLRYPLRTICWWLAEAGRLNAHVRQECTGSL